MSRNARQWDFRPAFRIDITKCPLASRNPSFKCTQSCRICHHAEITNIIVCLSYNFKNSYRLK